LLQFTLFGLQFDVVTLVTFGWVPTRSVVYTRTPTLFTVGPVAVRCAHGLHARYAPFVCTLFRLHVPVGFWLFVATVTARYCFPLRLAFVQFVPARLHDTLVWLVTPVAVVTTTPHTTRLFTLRLRGLRLRLLVNVIWFPQFILLLHVVGYSLPCFLTRFTLVRSIGCQFGFGHWTVVLACIWLFTRY